MPIATWTHKIPSLGASKASLKRMINDLKVHNDSERFQTECTCQPPTGSAKARHLFPPGTAGLSIAHEQLLELLNLLGEKRDLNNSLQYRVDQKMIISVGFELGAQSYRKG